MADHQPASPSMPPAIDSSQPAKSSQTTHVGATETPTGPIEEGADVAEAPETNGDTDHKGDDTASGPFTSTHATQDLEMREATEGDAPAGAGSSPVPTAVNGTPALTKRASTTGLSKKKSAAVPEHKSKKLNKKKSKPLTNLNAQPGEYFFARMKGHPAWPSIICDEAMLPQSLLSSRPVTARLADGSFKREDYADGGKRAYERTYPVMFLHTNEFAWIPNTELTPLDTTADSTQQPSEKGKTKLLLSAYAKAAEAHGLDHFRKMLADHHKALEEDLAEKEEREAEREAKKAKKNNRKSSDAVAVGADVDEMDIDSDEGVEKPKPKKRKKGTEDEALDEKPAKTPKTATKLKLSTPKTPSTEQFSKKKQSKSKGKAAKSGSEDDAQTPKVEGKPLTAAAAKEIKEKKVLYYRHKLQRGFLSRDTVPKEEEMKSMSDFLAELESYPDLEGSIIRATKIHKVLKAIIKLQSIPLEEEFNFKTRSQDLLDKWNDILSKDSTETSGEKSEEKGEDNKPENVNSPAPVTNGGSTVEASTSKEAPGAKLNDGVEGADGVNGVEQPKAAEVGTAGEQKQVDESATNNALTQGQQSEDNVAATT